MAADFSDGKFGKLPGWAQFVGRRLDLLGRSLPVRSAESPTEALRGYLSAGGTASARALAAKAVVLIYPEAELGRAVWPMERVARTGRRKDEGRRRSRGSEP
jgi:hypothetical protein